ncbi:POK18 protein, partial [Atlantisia rogersi]|nr:POK18 protein [Atlantisia rogersi]
LELQVVVKVFDKWTDEPVNIVCDSLYVVGIVTRMECALLKGISDERVYSLFKELWLLLSNRQHQYFITHIRSHTGLTQGLAEGNQRADRLVAPAWAAPSVDRFAQARRSHEFFHQSAKVLQRQYHLSVAEAKGIVQSCLDCQQFTSGLAPGVNP